MSLLTWKDDMSSVNRPIVFLRSAGFLDAWSMLPSDLPWLSSSSQGLAEYTQRELLLCVCVGGGVS